MEALGRLRARYVGAEEGSLAMEANTAAAPEENVVTRKTWITWNMKYQACVLSSAWGRVGSPESFAMSVDAVLVGLKGRIEREVVFE